MIPAELAGLIHYLPPENPMTFPAEFNMIQTNLPSFYNLHGFINNSSPGQEFIASSLSNNSTSDEAEDHQQSIIDERKQRRMISNRESARRSRMRKQKHLDELWSQVIRLRNENHSLIERLNRVSESHERVLKENARLKEEASDLRQMLTEMKANDNGGFGCVLRDFEDLNPSTTP